MALKGAPDGSQFNLDTLFPIAESLVPTIFQQVALSYVGDPQAESLLRRTHTVAMTSGVGTLPDEALTSCKFGASIADPDDVTVAQTQTLVPFWSDFIQPRNGIQLQLNWWTVKGDDELNYLAPQEEYPGSFTGDLEVTIASVPSIPSTSSATLDVPGEVLSDLQDALSKALMGEMKKAA
jgi:hypothetical protein